MSLRRFLWPLIALLLVTQLAGVGAVVAEAVESACADECGAECAEDDAGGDCTPTCDDCSCCLHAQPLPQPAGVSFAPPPSVVGARGEPGAVTATGDPREILHVPRSTT